MTLATWLTLFAACWAISLSPGAGAVAAMSAGLAHGVRKGYFMVFGLILGIWTQILLVGLGLGALIAASETAFAVVKWAGVAYLVYLGIQAWRSPPQTVHTREDARRETRGQLVMRGWGINAVNPKGTVFLLAVTPQFLDLHAPMAPQYLIIAATLTVTDMVVMGGYAALAAKVLQQLRSPRHVRLIQRTFGSFFIAAGAALAWFKRTP